MVQMQLAAMVFKRVHFFQCSGGVFWLLLPRMLSILSIFDDHFALKNVLMQVLHSSF